MTFMFSWATKNSGGLVAQKLLYHLSDLGRVRPQKLRGMIVSDKAKHLGPVRTRSSPHKDHCRGSSNMSAPYWRSCMSLAVRTLRDSRNKPVVRPREQAFYQTKSGGLRHSQRRLDRFIERCEQNCRDLARTAKTNTFTRSEVVSHQGNQRA